MLLKLFLASVTVLFATADDTAVLNCDTLTGDLRWKMIRFSRAMEVGDRLTVTGTVYSSANMSYLHLYQGFQNKYEDGIVSLHIRAQYERNSIIYNSFLDRTNWGREEFGPLPYRKATKYTITVVGACCRRDADKHRSSQLSAFALFKAHFVP
uniref:Galectin n=1 Tax=Caenorhabditis japonica TaxID=281687 RepID=A0A8R1J0U0_CAEJA